MAQTLLEMAKELVTELIRAHHLSPDDARSLLLSTHAALQSLHHSEASNSAAASPDTYGEAAPATWRRSITKHAVTCLECGDSFRQLSSRHLRVHNLDAREYRSKYGIPSTQPLSSREATARRRELAQQIRPWEQAASKRASAKAKRGGNPPQDSRRRGV
jgi:predicted transcriptional regulator